MPWKKNEPMDQRIEFALRALRTDNFRALCVEYGISPKTGYKWRARLLRRETAGLAEESRCPRGHADQLSPEVVCEMVRLKNLHPYWGPRKLRALGIAK
jgi:transposase-like protein